MKIHHGDAVMAINAGGGTRPALTTTNHLQAKQAQQAQQARRLKLPNTHLSAHQSLSTCEADSRSRQPATEFRDFAVTLPFVFFPLFFAPAPPPPRQGPSAWSLPRRRLPPPQFCRMRGKHNFASHRTCVTSQREVHAALLGPRGRLRLGVGGYKSVSPPVAALRIEPYTLPSNYCHSFDPDRQLFPFLEHTETYLIHFSNTTFATRTLLHWPLLSIPDNHALSCHTCWSSSSVLRHC